MSNAVEANPTTVPAAAAGETPAAAPELRRTLGLSQGVALYAGSVLGTGVLVLPAIAAQTAGPASILAWLGLVLLSLPLAATYAALSIQRPDAGGFSDAIERAFGKKWGGVAGWFFVAQTPTGSVVAALIAGQSAATVLGGGEDTALIAGAALTATAYLLNIIGLRISAGAQLATLAIITLGLAVITARALPEIQAEHFTPFFPMGVGAVGVAAAQLFWAFVGWEAITPLAKEFRDTRDIWRASMIAVVVVGVVYLALAAAVIGTRTYGGTGDQAPLVVLARSIFGGQASRVVGIAGFLLCFIPMNAYFAGTSRLVYAMAERRQFPRFLAKLSPAGTPVRALLFLATGTTAALIATHTGKLSMADVLPVSTSAFLATYVLSLAAAVKLLRPPLSYAALFSLVVCLAVLWFVGPLLLWLVVLAAASLIYQFIAGRRRA